VYKDQVSRCGTGATHEQVRRTRLGERIDKHDGGGDTPRPPDTGLLRSDCLGACPERNQTKKQGLQLHSVLRVRS
jgi:hypothetical protein